MLERDISSALLPTILFREYPAHIVHAFYGLSCLILDDHFVVEQIFNSLHSSHSHLLSVSTLVCYDCDGGTSPPQATRRIRSQFIFSLGINLRKAARITISAFNFLLFLQICKLGSVLVVCTLSMFSGLCLRLYPLTLMFRRFFL